LTIVKIQYRRSFSPYTVALRVLILNQPFHPDHVATAQYATDLALELAARGHTVTAIASARAYDDPARTFPLRETYRAIDIRRVRLPGLGKSSVRARIGDFAAYALGTLRHLAALPPQDAVVALTTPPLIGAFGAAFTRLRGGRLHYWVMDLNPDQALTAGVLQPGAPLTRLLEGMLRFTLREAAAVHVLDRFMQQRLETRRESHGKFHVIPPWSLDAQVRFDPAGRDEFRRAHGLAGKFVVMHSGNHSPCHPLDTILEAARRLQGDPRYAFVFAGGGVEHRKVQQHNLPNVLALPYQPVERLSASLSAADLHVVAMGAPFVGILHPCKVYNILRLGLPILYLGPEESHVTDLAPAGAPWLYRVAPGAVEEAVRAVQSASGRETRPDPAEMALCERYSRVRLLGELVAAIEARAAI
jgi:hypothetical protein